MNQIARCQSCDTTYPLWRENEGDIEIQKTGGPDDPWIVGCAVCGNPNLELEEEDEDE